MNVNVAYAVLVAENWDMLASSFVEVSTTQSDF